MLSQEGLSSAVRRRVARWLSPERETVASGAPATRPNRSARANQAVRAHRPGVPELIPMSPPGTHVSSRFFRRYPRFFDTSEVAATRARLNLRYEAIIAENRDILQGARVLDIASHDGRWSFAALDAGAASVLGIEGRPELVNNAGENLASYGVSQDRYEFVAGDIFDVLADREVRVDVVMCLGFMYHTLRYNELMHGIRATGARYVIIDTQAKHLMAPEPLVRLVRERHEHQSAAVADDFVHGDTVLTGRPSLAAITLMMEAYGYAFDRLSDWGGILRDNPNCTGVGQYRKQQRTTVRYVDVSRGVAPSLG